MPQMSEAIWLVTFTSYDLGTLDDPRRCEQAGVRA